MTPSKKGDTMFSINSLAESSTEPHFDTPAFKIVLEDHLEKIKSSDRVLINTIESTVGDKYKGDFYGLLQHLSIPPEHRWITMRLNGYSSTSDFDGLQLDIKLPSVLDLHVMMSRYLTSRV